MNSQMCNYKKIDEEDLAFFRSVCAPERVIAGEEIGEDYSHDELSGIRCYPEVLIKVISTDEVSRIMAYASKQNICVTPRGQGTGLVGGALPRFGGILLDLSSMNRILELDEENMTLTLECGVLLMEVVKFTEEHGFLYPPDPGEKSATIGGNINTNAGGMRAVKYGVTRDYVRALEVVLPDGTVCNFGGKVVKNSSGYSLKDLIVGSEGTLGIVTRATLRLLPLPKCKISLLVPFCSLPDAIESIPRILSAGAIPTALEFMEKEVILSAEEFLGRKFPDNSADAYLLLTFDADSPQALEHSWRNAADVCLECGALDVLISDTQDRNDSIWPARGAFLEAIKASTTEMDECDVVVPRKHVAEFVLFARSLQAKHQIRIRSFGHAGDGNLHIYILRDQLPEADWKEKLETVFQELYAKSRALGGQVSGEHGIGFAKRSYLADSQSPANLALMAAIKKAFDPGNILNPGKILQ